MLLEPLEELFLQMRDVTGCTVDVVQHLGILDTL